MLGDLFAFFSSVISQWTAWVTGSVGVALVFILERRSNMQVPWYILRWVFGWGGLLVAVFLAWQSEHTRRVQIDHELAQAKQSPPLPPDYIDLHRPWLTADVIISEYHDETFRLMYQITNTGKLPAESLRILFASPIMSGFDNSIRSPHSIAAGDSISVEPNPLRFETKRLEPFSTFTLAVEYQASVAGAVRVFQALFELTVRIEELKEGRLKPSAVLHAEGLFTDQTIKELMATPFAR